MALDLALRHPRHVRALALLEGDALGLSATARHWTRQLRSKVVETVQRDGIASAPVALFAEVMGPGTWESLPARVKAVLRDNAPALLAELAYVDEPAPEAEAIAAIRVPVLLVEAESSPMEQRDMTRALVDTLPAARHVVVPGGHLIDPASVPVIEFLRKVA